MFSMTFTNIIFKYFMTENMTNDADGNSIFYLKILSKWFIMTYSIDFNVTEEI